MMPVFSSGILQMLDGPLKVRRFGNVDEIIQSRNWFCRGHSFVCPPRMNWIGSCRELSSFWDDMVETEVAPQTGAKGRPSHSDSYRWCEERWGVLQI